MEITFESSQDHEDLVDLCYTGLHQNQTHNRSLPWMPHASLAYDNPGMEPMSREYLQNLVERLPTLAKERRVTGIGLWNTSGTLDCWKCFERFAFVNAGG